MSEAKQRTIHLAGLAISEERRGLKAAEAVWKQAEEESRLAFFPGDPPVVKTGGLELVPAAEFFKPVCAPDIPNFPDISTSAPPEVGGYPPPSFWERAGDALGLVAHTFKSALVEMKMPPDVTAGELFLAAVSGFNGNEIESSSPALPPVLDDVEAGKAAILATLAEMTDKFGNRAIPYRDKTPADEAREAAYLRSRQAHSSMFHHHYDDWLEK